MWMRDTGEFEDCSTCPLCGEGTIFFEKGVGANSHLTRIACNRCGLDPRVEGNYTASEREQKAAISSIRYDSPIATRLLALATIAEKKHHEYGATYDMYGPVMVALFPDGIGVGTKEAWNQLGVINMIVHKLMRYAENIDTGGHKDSADDIAVYGAILSELTK